MEGMHLLLVRCREEASLFMQIYKKHRDNTIKSTKYLLPFSDHLDLEVGTY